MDVTKIDGVVGSFEVTRFATGEIDIKITYSKGAVSTIRTNAFKVEELWIPQLEGNNGRTATIPEQKAIEIVHKPPHIHISPPYASLSSGEVAMFNSEQVKRIVRALRGNVSPTVVRASEAVEPEFRHTALTSDEVYSVLAALTFAVMCIMARFGFQFLVEVGIRAELPLLNFLGHVLVFVSIVLGSGCAIYAFLKIWRR